MIYVSQQFIDHVTNVELKVGKNGDDKSVVSINNINSGQPPLEMTLQQFQRIMAFAEMWIHPKY